MNCLCQNFQRYFEQSVVVLAANLPKFLAQDRAVPSYICILLRLSVSRETEKIHDNPILNIKGEVLIQHPQGAVYDQNITKIWKILCFHFCMNHLKSCSMAKESNITLNIKYIEQRLHIETFEVNSLEQNFACQPSIFPKIQNAQRKLITQCYKPKN